MANGYRPASVLAIFENEPPRRPTSACRVTAAGRWAIYQGDDLALKAGAKNSKHDNFLARPRTDYSRPKLDSNKQNCQANITLLNVRVMVGTPFALHYFSH